MVDGGGKHKDVQRNARGCLAIWKALRAILGAWRSSWAGLCLHVGSGGGHLADLEGHLESQRSGRSQDEQQERDKLPNKRLSIDLSMVLGG